MTAPNLIAKHFLVFTTSKWAGVIIFSIARIFIVSSGGPYWWKTTFVYTRVLNLWRQYSELLRYSVVFVPSKIWFKNLVLIPKYKVIQLNKREQIKKIGHFNSQLIAKIFQLIAKKSTRRFYSMSRGLTLEVTHA